MATNKADAWGIETRQTVSGSTGWGGGSVGSDGWKWDPPMTRTSQSASAPASARLDTSDLSGEDRDAASALIQLFRQYGLDALGPKILDYVKKGYGSDTIALLLQDTTEWKQRFSGNETRRKAGLPVLSPAEYLATERAYRQVAQQYGLPAGFYDSPSDFAGFIGNDMSPQEFQTRVQTASQYAHSQDQSTKDALRRLYGLGPGDLAAWALDQNRALPLIEKQAKAVAAGAAALRQGLNTSRGYAEHLADLGITGEQAEQGYSTIREMLPTFTSLGRIYDMDYSQNTAEKEIFEGSAAARDTRKKLASQERATFSGSSRGQVGRTNSSY